MRQGITLKKSHAGRWSVVSTPDVPFEEQRKAFNKLPTSKSEDSDTAEVVLVPLDGKRKTYSAPKAAKKVAKKKVAED